MSKNMKLENLEDRVLDYTNSIETVIEKKIYWKKKTKDLIRKTLTDTVIQYDIGWRLRELNWINSNEAVNIVFDSFPPSLMGRTNEIPSYQFIQGASLAFSQSYGGDVYVFIMLPVVEQIANQNNILQAGVYSPQEITVKLIIEKIDEFLKEMINWEVIEQKNTTVGFKSH